MECPHCQNKTEVPDLWEFFDCTNCGASLQLENNKLKTLRAPNENTPAHSEQKLQSQATSPVEGSISKEAQEHSTESSAHILPTDRNEEATTNEFSEISNDTASSPLEEEFQNNNEQAEPIQGTAQSPGPEENEKLSGILGFENPPNQKNLFTYHLHVSEISSKALFNKIRHILKNPRVKLDCQNQTASNTLIINNLNAVQIVYLIRKLSPLSVQIHWTQNSTLAE